MVRIIGTLLRRMRVILESAVSGAEGNMIGLKERRFENVRVAKTDRICMHLIIFETYLQNGITKSYNKKKESCFFSFLKKISCTTEQRSYGSFVLFVKIKMPFR